MDSFHTKIDNKEYKVILPNYHGFDHDAVASVMEGDFEYTGSIFIDGFVWAVYANHEPNIEKGHKDLMMLRRTDSGGLVSGRGLKEFEEKHNHQNGKACEKCNEIIYSMHRHDYRHCSCRNVMVDGGTDYFRASLSGLNVKIDFINKTTNLSDKE